MSGIFIPFLDGCYEIMMAPSWLTTRINYTTIKFVYRIIDGHETLKAVGISIMPAWTLSQERLIIIQFSSG